MLLRIEEATAYLKLSRTTLHRLVSAGQLAAVRIGGRVLFRRETLDTFIKKNERPARRAEAEGRR